MMSNDGEVVLHNYCRVEYCCRDVVGLVDCDSQKFGNELVTSVVGLFGRRRLMWNFLVELVLVMYISMCVAG